MVVYILQEVVDYEGTYFISAHETLEGAQARANELYKQRNKSDKPSDLGWEEISAHLNDDHQRSWEGSQVENHKRVRWAGGHWDITETQVEP